MISLGGGVILRPANRDALAKSESVRVYLKADAQTLHARVHADPATAANRPALTSLGGDAREIAALLAEREPLYRASATHELDVASRGVDEVVGELEKIVRPQMNADERR